MCIVWGKGQSSCFSIQIAHCISILHWKYLFEGVFTGYIFGIFFCLYSFFFFHTYHHAHFPFRTSNTTCNYIAWHCLNASLKLFSFPVSVSFLSIVNFGIFCFCLHVQTSSFTCLISFPSHPLEFSSQNTVFFISRR